MKRINWMWMILASLAFSSLAAAQTTAPAEPPTTQPAVTQPQGPLPVDVVDTLTTVLGPTFARTSLTHWIILFAAIFIGLAAGKITQTFLRSAGQRLIDRNWAARGLTFQNAASPVSLALLTLGLTVGLQVIYLEGDIKSFFAQVVKLLYILAVGWFLYNLIDVIELGLIRITSKTESKLDDMIVPLIRKALRILLVIMFTLVVAQNVFGLNITGWLAGLGIAGLAVSLAAQDSIKNLFGSITVFFDKPFAVGDRIKFEGFDGAVEEIGFRSTKVRTLEGHLATIPNMKFIDNSVENVQARPAIPRIFSLGLTYDTPPEKVEQAVQIVRQILAEPEMTRPFNMEKQPPKVFFDAFAADSLNVKVYYWFQGNDWWAYNQHAQLFNLKVLRAFTEAGIELAFTTRTLFLAGDPKRELRIRLEGEPPNQPQMNADERG